MAKSRTLTLRLDPDTSARLEQVREHFGVATASGAIQNMLLYYLDTCQARDQLQSEFNALQRCHSNLVNDTQALRHNLERLLHSLDQTQS